MAAPAAREILTPDRPVLFRAVDNEVLLAPEASLLSASTFAEITPFAPGDTQKRADEIVFKNTGVFATGKVRKGPFRGKQLTIQIDPYHYPSGGGAHGDHTVKVYAQDKQASKYVGQFDTNVFRTMSIGYGHYTFVVTGSSSGGGFDPNGQRSTIAWSEDGIKWRRVDLGYFGQINGIAVGPRPKDADPTPPGADEITTGGKTVGGGAVPNPYA
jgi:hypothetical protein